jgi:hypothetical protein
MNSVGYRTPNNTIIVSDEFDFRGSLYTDVQRNKWRKLRSVVHSNIQRTEWRKLRIFSAQKDSGN